jgi:DNA (cytosine-5)-methyltransferase 1
VAYPKILSLFSGVAGLDLGIRIAIPNARILGYVERDAYPSSVLLARMEEGALETAPVWIGDIQDLDGGDLRRRIDLICGGFPCQDISVAGKGEGIAGKRSGLFFELIRLVREVEPRFVFLENVSAITNRGLDAVLGELAEIGFDAAWTCIRASDVGAPHRRERWFCLAVSRHQITSCTGSDTQPEVAIDATGAYSATVADADEGRELQPGGCEPNERRRTSDECDTVAHTASGSPRHTGTAHEQGSERLTGTTGEGVDNPMRGRHDHEEEEVRAGWNGTFPPGPTDHDAWRAVLEHYPHLPPAIESGVCVLVNGMAVVVDEDRSHQLRCTGNGVIPIQAAIAFIHLAQILGVVKELEISTVEKKESV